MRLFLVYSTGNFIEATAETCYFQIGEAKYGKPVLDRMLVPSTPLAEGTKCALVSIDDPSWGAAEARYPLRVRSDRYEVLRKISNPDERIV